MAWEGMQVASNVFPHELVEGLQKLRDINVGVDIYLCSSDGKKLPAHKVVLSAVSPYFRNMWQKGALMGTELPFEHVSHKVLSLVLDFVYTGRMRLNTETVWHVLSTTTELELKDAPQLCRQFIENHMSADSAQQQAIENMITVAPVRELISLVKEEPLVEGSGWDDDYVGQEGDPDDDCAPKVRSPNTRSRKRKSLVSPKQNNTDKKKRASTKGNLNKVLQKATKAIKGKNNAAKTQNKEIDTETVPKSRSYQCDICNRVFNYKSVLNLHYKQHGHISVNSLVLRSFQCVQVQRKFDHLTAKAPSMKRKIKCDKCRKRFSFYSTWRKHFVLKHLRSYNCKNCDRTFVSSLLLRQHCARKHEYKIITSRKVLKKFKIHCRRLKSFRAEMETGEPIKQGNKSADYSCKCGQVFKNEKQLKLHAGDCLEANHPGKTSGSSRKESNVIRETDDILDAAVAAARIMEITPIIHQSDAFKGSAPNSGTVACIADSNLSTVSAAPNLNVSVFKVEGLTLERRRFECAECGSAYATHSGLSRHKKKHLQLQGGNEIFPCKQCTRTYQSRQSLIRHITEQHSNTLYKCQLCSFTNSSQRKLIQHQATVHEGLKYVCDAPDCGKTFLSQSGLKSHKEGVHQDITFECAECNKTFSVKYLWREHFKIHHENRVIKCDFCDRFFKYRSSRIAHMKARHSHLLIQK